MIFPKKIKIIITSFFFLPIISFAVTTTVTYNGGGLWNLFSIVQGILSKTVGLMISFGVVFFLFGVVKYIKSGDDAEGVAAAKNVMIYGIIGLFVMVSMWGLVNILVNTFQLNNSQNVRVPYLDTGSVPSGNGNNTLPAPVGTFPVPTGETLPTPGNVFPLPGEEVLPSLEDTFPVSEEDALTRSTTVITSA